MKMLWIGWKNKTKIKPYHIINFVLAGIIMLIFIYSGLFSAEKGNHPIPSFYEELYGKTSPSSGLSRSFSEIVRGRFKSAGEYNPNGIPVFIFFLVQLFQRLSVSLIIHRKNISFDRIVLFDSLSSAILFLYCFRGLIKAFIQNFS